MTTQILKDFINFANSQDDNGQIDHYSWITCAVGDFHRHINKPLSMLYSYNVGIREQSELYNELYDNNLSLLFKINDCDTYGKLKEVLAKNILTD